MKLGEFHGLFPHLRHFVVVRKEHSDAGFVFNPFTSEIAVNWLGVDVARLCDGARSVDMIVEAIQRRHSLSQDAASGAVAGALRRFDAAQMLDWRHDAAASRVEGAGEAMNSEAWELLALAKHMEKNCFTAPLNVIWEITAGCNLKCRHCLTASGERLPNELTLSEVARVVDELVDMKVLRISFVGGEPLVRKDFLEILSYCSTKDIAVEFSTNGYAFTPAVLKALEDLNIFSVQVSIDGLGDSHDEFRGRKGSFDKAIRALELARDGGLRATISTTVTRNNYLEIPAMIDRFRAMGIPMISYKAIPFMPVGRGRENESELSLTPAQIKEYSRSMREKKRECGDSFVVDNEGAYSWLFDDADGAAPVPADARVGCGAGRTLAVIGADGSVYPCPFLHDFRAGDLREQSFLDIWQNSAVFEVFRRIKKGDLKGKCRDCEYLPEKCSGGCRASAYAATGDLYAEDPCCWAHLR